MRHAQHVERQRRRQPARIPHLEPVREQHDLHTAVVRVVAVRHRVNDGFGDDLGRDLVRSGRPDSFRPRADCAIDLAKHEIHCLIDQLERRSLVDLVRWNRLRHLHAVEMGALDFGSDQEPLRRLPEQKHRGVGWAPFV